MFGDTYLFEISWEVCNKVGGIHTVITSKLPFIKPHFKNYFCMGVYNETSKNNFSQIQTPEQFKQQTSQLEKLGIKIHFGKWNIDNNTNVILIEHMGYSEHINSIKGILWEKYHIDSLGSQWYDYDEAMLWSWTCGIVIDKLTSNLASKIIVHAHEWMAGGAIFYIKQYTNKTKYKTIFTTHATMLGRALSGSGENLLSIQEKINPDEYAYKVKVHTKHQTEKSLANNSDIFSTVSDITNKEAFYFYGKFADTLLYNGFNKEIETNSSESKEKINEFIKSYFHNFYPINLDNTQIMYTSGRNEFQNKGTDLIIDSLGKLNQKLKEENSDKNIIFFFLIPVGSFEFDPFVLNSIDNYKKKIFAEKTFTYVPLSTHLLPINNEIIEAFIKAQLLNREEDKVKVILNPSYIDEKEYFFSRHYYDVISGLDLGIFASSYEPWGYTPVESITYSVPTITTDMAGFGKYYENKIEKCDCVFILNRKDKTFEESSQMLTKHLNGYINKSNDELNNLKEKAQKMSKNFSWEKFIDNYLKAYKTLLEK